MTLRLKLKLPKRPPAVEQLSPAGRLIGFLLFSTVGLAAFGAAVLLPEYAALATLRHKCDVKLHQIQCDRNAALYNQRLIDGIENDPTLTADLLMRHANYHMADAVVYQVDPARPTPSPAERLRLMAANPPPPDRGLPVLIGEWMDIPSIRAGLALLGLGMTLCALILFGPAQAEPVSAPAEAA